MIIRLAIVLLLAACGAPAPRVIYYDLSGGALPSQCTNPRGPIIALTDLEASATARGDEIAIRSVDGHIDHYLYHRWQAPVPRLVTELIAERFAASGEFRRVDLNELAADAEVIASGRILRFEGARREGETSVARIVIELSARSKQRSATFTRRFTKVIPVTDRSIRGLVQALRRAVIAIAREAAPHLAALGEPESAEPPGVASDPDCRVPRRAGAMLTIPRWSEP